MTGYTFQDNIQRGILYLIKNDREFLVEATPLIKSSYFDLNLHSRIYTAIQSYYDKYAKLPSDDILIESLKETKESHEFSGEFEQEIGRINSLNRKSIDHKEAYMDMVEKFARNERMKEAIISSVELLDKHDYDGIFTNIKNALEVRRNIDLGTSFLENELDRWDRFYGTKAISNKITTGFSKFDKSLEGGLSRKEIGMIVAASGRGKSLFLTRLAMIGAIKELNVVYITLEMSEDAVAARIDTMLTKLPYASIKDNRDEYIRRIEASKKYIKGDINIKQFPATQATVGTVRAYLSQLQGKTGKKVDLLVVDYLELLRPSIDGMAEYAAQQRITQELRGLAIEQNVLVWTATQGNRDSLKVPYITESELADSFGKIREVDYAYSINQTDSEKDEGKARLYVIKSRNSISRFAIEAKIDYNTLSIGEVKEDDTKKE